ncbi:hypothetical protein [Kribbella solani]|uniref:Uncharacterized protein n=1 Tax=Kribbella solani TaxID=236067 RepID=A0A841DVK1_9ACTN|nr:hypothetical protein [Kribbella solani]MBB5979318.1 hypothetical protein [Kribbella solani]
MRLWKRIVAVLVVAALALLVEGLVARAQAGPPQFGAVRLIECFCSGTGAGVP